jgi:hypothetical protein
LALSKQGSGQDDRGADDADLDRTEGQGKRVDRPRN